MKYYKTCSTLPIFNFYQILDTNNLSYLIQGYEDGDKHVLNNELKGVFETIIQEYSELTSNTEVIFNLELQTLILEYEFVRDVLQNTLNLYSTSNDFSILSLLEPFNIFIKKDGNLETQLKKVIKKIKGLNNKIRINKDKHAKRFKKNNDTVKTNLDKEALQLELNLSLGREINTKTTTVTKWINMIEISKEKSAEIQKIRNK